MPRNGGYDDVQAEQTRRRQRNRHCCPVVCVLCRVVVADGNGSPLDAVIGAWIDAARKSNYSGLRGRKSLWTVGGAEQRHTEKKKETAIPHYADHCGHCSGARHSLTGCLSSEAVPGEIDCPDQPGDDSALTATCGPPKPTRTPWNQHHGNLRTRRCLTLQRGIDGQLILQSLRHIKLDTFCLVHPPTAAAAQLISTHRL